MKKKVALLITYNTEEATKKGIIHVIAECVGGIEEIEEVKLATVMNDG